MAHRRIPTEAVLLPPDMIEETARHANKQACGESLSSGSGLSWRHHRSGGSSTIWIIPAATSLTLWTTWLCSCLG
ncbi:hypothetical protein DPEC_G00090800 [Dallia pectoralis]|uniref:Uncharacterized protein n=1 Tax=Dallia pectoralis TaxID=75939 RepID=A0ACC2H1N2_DALPE|nr:hypothetical protein DPEC_G00090800 [Dallia pectoralis]